jgi:lipoprotein-anchoring transpeptidase ErfK/SrfK
VRYGRFSRILLSVGDKPKAVHAKRQSGRSGVLIVVVALATLAVGGGVATFLLNGSSSSANGGAGAVPTTVKMPTVSVLPADGATNVPIDSTISVTADIGRINAVTVAAPNGTPLTGGFDSGGRGWRSTGSLALQTSYTVTVDAVGPSGSPMQQVTHFKSLVPTATLGLTLTPGTGLTVGIAQPIVFRFDHTVTNKDAIISRLQVTASPAVAGGWHWFSAKELHFRPEKYWTTGEKVTVTADLAGFDAGSGIWGTTNSATDFTVGDAHISTVNVQTHMMTVTSNGQTVHTYPISAGRSKYPTMNGIHIDLYRQQDVHMISSSVGIPVNSGDGYDEHVFWNVNITDGGEYVHAAPWSTGAQGNSNVSHGCVNLPPGAAQEFYNFSRIGDVIEVVGSSRAPDLGDHGVMDWNTPWSAWTPATTA